MNHNEKQDFLNIMSDYLNCRKTIERPENMEMILEIAKKQQLQMIVLYQCYWSNSINQSKDYAVAMFQWVNRNKILNDLLKIVSAEKIQIALVKGYEIEKLYKPNFLRLMGDTDIVIHPDDRARVHGIMQNMGFDCINSVGDEWTYIKNNCCFEVHDSMVHPHKGNEHLLEYFNNLWVHGYMADNYFRLDWNFHFCYLIQHISGHVIMTGIGFRQFLDLVIVINNTQLNWDWIKIELEHLGLWKFTKNCLALCKRWFEVDIPIETEALDEIFYLKVTKKMFADGVFGRDNPVNKKVSKMVEKQVYGGKTAIESRIEIASEKIFPSCDYIGKLPYCKFVLHHKFLLPVAWIWRLIYRIFVKSDFKNEYFKHISVDGRTVDNRTTYLKQWGL